MKRAFFLFFTLLAVLALASSSPDAPTTSDLATSSIPEANVQEVSTSDTDTSQTTDEESPHQLPVDDDLIAELHAITGSNTTWPNITHSNISASTAGDVETLTDQNKMKHLKSWYRVDIRMGLTGTHVGTFGGERLYTRMYELLKRCKNGGNLDDCVISNVVWSNGGRYSTDSKLYLNVLLSSINTRLEGLEDLTYRMMARAFQKMTETPSNCYPASLSPDHPGGPTNEGGTGRNLWFCNVASQVMIVYPINGGPMQSLLKVTLEWDHATDQKHYKCDEIAQSNTIMDWVSKPFVNDYYLLGGKKQDAFRKEIAKLHNWKANRVATYTSCLWDHCFNTRSEMAEPRHEWIEVDDCEPNWNPIGCDPGSETRKQKSLHCPPEYRGTRTYTHGKLNTRNDGDYWHWDWNDST
ncbi:hypothetical protein ACET3X_002169 [Alternaria dauci]|uniref:Uncharacterized protein n=1 Tax=Alternaria dauci TaxID=48095 RepID=A0ABR3UPG0_9PLEO